MENRTWVEISKSAIEKNIKSYSKLLPKDTSLMAVLKSNAYGHGQDIVCDVAISCGIDQLAVFTIEDGLNIRKKYKDIPILVLNQITVDELNIALKNNIDITVGDIETLKQITKFKNKGDLLINLKIDTGLSRQGFLLNDLPTVLDILKNNDNINIVSIYTHLIGAENKRFDKYTNKQSTELKIWQDAFNNAGYYPLVHISGTAGFLMKNNLANDVVRLGIGMYGLWPSDEVTNVVKNKLKLIPALSWKTRITQVKNIKKGDVVAYNATFTASKNITIAILPIGYWDGLPRSLSGKGYMLAGGSKCPILGRIMMNMCVIDITDIKGLKTGDEVVIIGKQGKNTISADELALSAGTINYEIVTRINPQIPRIAIN